MTAQQFHEGLADLFDVMAVNIKTGARRKLFEKKSWLDAEAIVRMAIARRGVTEEFYEAAPHLEIKP